jgi:hypothetical protein
MTTASFEETTTSTSSTSATGSTQKLRSYTSYLDAQAAVDYLSDNKFPVEHLDIVGRDIRIVESVSGRLTKGRATLAGAASGAWFGLFIGVLLGIFLPGAALFSLVISAIAFAAVWGAIFGFVGHWATRGRRDFASTKSLDAGRYDVLINALYVSDAEKVLAGRYPSTAL